MEYALKNTHIKGSEVSDFLEDKTGKLQKFLEGKFHARWNITYEQEEHEAHLHLTGSHFDYIGKGRDANLYTAVEAAVDKVQKQLQRHKETVQDHR